MHDFYSYYDPLFIHHLPAQFVPHPVLSDSVQRSVWTLRFCHFFIMLLTVLRVCMIALKTVLCFFHPAWHFWSSPYTMETLS